MTPATKRPLRKDNVGVSLAGAIEVMEFIMAHEPTWAEACEHFGISRASFKRVLDCLRAGGVSVMAVCEKRGPGGGPFFYRVMPASVFRPEELVFNDPRDSIAFKRRRLPDGVAAMNVKHDA